MDFLDKRVENFCPSGIDRCECVHAPGNFTKGPISFKDDLLGSLITFVGCNPGFCFCKDAPNVEVDIREHMLRAVMDLCPRGEMDRCLCVDNRKIIWPFTMSDVISCSPRKCKCKGSNKPKAMTAFGCAQGGSPRCAEDKFICKDGISRDINDVMKRYIDFGETGCSCPDGNLFKCIATGEFPVCP